MHGTYIYILPLCGYTIKIYSCESISVYMNVVLILVDLFFPTR